MTPYRVSNSKAVAEDFRKTIAQATKIGRQKECLSAAKWSLEELERTPHDFGESRGGPSVLGLERRIAFVGDLTIEFFIHEESHQVFIRRIRFR